MDAADSPPPERAYMIKSIIMELKGLQFTAPSPPDETINNAGEAYIKGMKPGPCLYGNLTEEEKLYDIRQRSAYNGEEQIEEQVEEDIEEGVEENEGESEGDPDTIMHDGELFYHNEKGNNDEEDLTNCYEKLKYDHECVKLPNGNLCFLWEYLDKEWDARIV
jgi:hypothetical protein